MLVMGCIAASCNEHVVMPIVYHTKVDTCYDKLVTVIGWTKLMV